MIDQKRLQSAAEALCDALAAEAGRQNAYFHQSPDGRVSLELEWTDPADLARVAVETYLRGATGAERRHEGTAGGRLADRPSQARRH